MNETVLNKKKDLENKINSSLDNMYFDVQVPLTVQKSMPVEFDFSL